MQPRSLYKSLRKRVGKTAPGRRLKRILKARRLAREEARLQQALNRQDWLFIVAETDRRFMYAEWLAWVEEHDPALHARIKTARLPAELPEGTAVLHAWVQDPVRERDAALYRELEDLETAAKRTRAHVVHPARVLSHSVRDVQFERLRRAGLRTPRIVAVDAGFADGLGGLSLPIVVRKEWGHCARLARLDSAEQVAEWLSEQAGALHEWVAAEYIDVRSADGYYRKYRYVLFGERGVCRHLIVSPNWEVRPRDRVLTDETVAEEVRFVSAPCGVHDVFDRARRSLEFDVAAFDYSFDASGALIVWEVNPYPDLSTPNGRPGEYLAEALLNTNRALAGMYHNRLDAVCQKRRRPWPFGGF